MKSLSGFICLHRKMLDWEWHSDPKTLTVFIHLLLLANWTDTQWRGKPLKRGQLITSRNSLAEMTGLSERQVRTALRHLNETGEVTINATNSYTLVTIENYSVYQDFKEKNDQQEVQQTTSETSNERPAKSPTNDHSVTNKTIEQERGAAAPHPPAFFIPPTLDEVNSYNEARGNRLDAETFFDFYEGNGWMRKDGQPVRNWKAQLRLWEKREKKVAGEDDEPWY